MKQFQLDLLIPLALLALCLVSFTAYIKDYDSQAVKSGIIKIVYGPGSNFR